MERRRPRGLICAAAALVTAMLIACGPGPHLPGPVGPPPPPKEVKAPLIYGEWRSGTFGSYIAPEPLDTGDDGAFDVVFHFHLGRSADAEYRASGIPAVIVSSATHGLFANAYRDAYEDPEKFSRAIDELTLLVRAKTGRADLKPRRIALVAWSAGYGAIRKILATPDYERIDAVILLDGLHTAYVASRTDKRLDDRDLEPFARFARDAAAGKKLFVFTHSSIVPVGYASTTETADALIAAAGGQRAPVAEETAAGGLVLESRADQGSLHVAGYAGEDKSSHVAHLRLVQGILTTYLAARWKP